MNDTVLGLLGLGVRAGSVVVGVEAVRAGLKRDALRCIVLAADASPRAGDKLLGLARGRRVPVVADGTAARLGARLGRPPVMAVGVRDDKLAAGILAAGRRSSGNGGVRG